MLQRQLSVVISLPLIVRPGKTLLLHKRTADYALERAKVCLGGCGHAYRVRNHGRRKFLTTGAAKKPTFIVIASTNSSKLLFGWISTPLTTAATGSRINRDWT